MELWFCDFKDSGQIRTIAETCRVFHKVLSKDQEDSGKGAIKSLQL